MEHDPAKRTQTVRWILNVHEPQTWSCSGQRLRRETRSLHTYKEKSNRCSYLIKDLVQAISPSSAKSGDSTLLWTQFCWQYGKDTCLLSQKMTQELRLFGTPYRHERIFCHISGWNFNLREHKNISRTDNKNMPETNKVKEDVTFLPSSKGLFTLNPPN